MENLYVADGGGWIFETQSLSYAALSGADSSSYGLAVRNAEVSVVPVPGAVWLLGSGLVGILGFRKKRR